MIYNFHPSCKQMHLSFKSICNKEHKGVICNTTSPSNPSQSTCPTGRVLGKNYSSFLDFTRNYERMSGIFVACKYLLTLCMLVTCHRLLTLAKIILFKKTQTVWIQIRVQTVCKGYHQTANVAASNEKRVNGSS